MSTPINVEEAELLLNIQSVVLASTMNTQEDVNTALDAQSTYHIQFNSFLTDTITQTQLVVMTPTDPTEKRIVYIGVRGTQDLANIMTDMKTGMVTWPAVDASGAAQFHKGFLSTVTNVIFKNNWLPPIINQYANVVFVGHSLGGAVAQLLGLYFHMQPTGPNVFVHTSASPQVGNAAAAAIANGSGVRVTNVMCVSDPVPIMCAYVNPLFIRWGNGTTIVDIAVTTAPGVSSAAYVTPDFTWPFVFNNIKTLHPPANYLARLSSVYHNLNSCGASCVPTSCVYSSTAARGDANGVCVPTASCSTAYGMFEACPSMAYCDSVSSTCVDYAPSMMLRRQ
jgi:hypothetical protein